MLGKAFESEVHHLIANMSVMGWLGHFLAIGVFGVAVPLRQGLDFLDVMFLLAYAFLPCLFAAPLVAESVAGRKISPPAKGYLAQVLTPCLFAAFWSLLILTSGLAAVNFSNWFGHVILPPAPVLLNVVLLGLAATFSAASVSGWLSLNAASASQAKGQSRRLFLMILLAVLMYARLAPNSWKHVVEDRLATDRITAFLLPVSFVLTAIGLAFLRTGAMRREEEAAGPVFKLQ
jgi:hypothetical protein